MRIRLAAASNLASFVLLAACGTGSIGGDGVGGSSTNGGTPNAHGGQSPTSGGGVTQGGATQGGSPQGGATQGGMTQGGSTSPNGGSLNPGNGGALVAAGGSSSGGQVSNAGNPATAGGSSAGGSAGGVTASGGSGGSGTAGATNNRGGAAGTGNGGSGTGGASKGGAGGTTNGGTTNGGSGSGGASKGGTGSGGAGNGGTGAGGTGKGGAGSGGASGGTGSGGTTSTGNTFSQCRFHFGTIDSKAKSGGTAMISQLDFFTPGWMQGEAFDQAYVCTEGNAGGALANQVPVVVAYISAAYVKRHFGLCDCNVTTCGANNDLCHAGAQYISQNLTAIVNAYKSYSQGYASCYGTTRPIIFEMEPDWYQYTNSSQTQPWSATQAGQIMGQLVAALKSSLPNARFSMDASPWVGPNNGTDNGAQWYSNFNMSLFTFVNTSGGGTNANTAKIRSSNNMTWAGLSQVTGKPILADTGYGANGVSAGHDPNWDVVANINARMADGVVSIAQYNPNTNWGSTISSIRSQLNTPKFCP